MNNTFLIAKRILLQLSHDKRFVALSLMAPIIITFLLKVFVDALPTNFPVNRYILPITAYVIHFVSFILSMIILVQERKGGTLERMFVNGIKKIEIVMGYLMGYLLLVTLQTFLAITEAILLFEFNLDTEVILLLFFTVWLLSLASISLGLFLSSFARNESHVIPFIPLVAIPSVFLSGLIVDSVNLPTWGQIIGKFTPLHYANNIIQSLVNNTYSIDDIGFIDDFAILFCLMIFFLILTAITIREEVM